MFRSGNKGLDVTQVYQRCVEHMIGYGKPHTWRRAAQVFSCLLGEQNQDWSEISYRDRKVFNNKLLLP